LAEDDESHAMEIGTHPLFTQMDVLVHFADNKMGWKEISRFVNCNATTYLSASSNVTDSVGY